MATAIIRYRPFPSPFSPALYCQSPTTFWLHASTNLPFVTRLVVPFHELNVNEMDPEFFWDSSMLLYVSVAHAFLLINNIPIVCIHHNYEVYLGNERFVTHWKWPYCQNKGENSFIWRKGAWENSIPTHDKYSQQTSDTRECPNMIKGIYRKHNT